MAHPASPSSSLCASQKQVAERDGIGVGGEDQAEHWWPPKPGKPGGQLPADCSEPLLEHHGGGGDVQVSRKLKDTQMEGQQCTAVVEVTSLTLVLPLEVDRDSVACPTAFSILWKASNRIISSSPIFS